MVATTPPPPVDSPPGCAPPPPPLRSTPRTTPASPTHGARTSSPRASNQPAVPPPAVEPAPSRAASTSPPGAKPGSPTREARLASSPQCRATSPGRAASPSASCPPGRLDELRPSELREAPKEVQPYFSSVLPRQMKWLPKGMDPSSACRVLVKVPAYVELPVEDYHVTENLKFVVDKDTTNWMDLLADLKSKINYGNEQELHVYFLDKNSRENVEIASDSVLLRDQPKWPKVDLGFKLHPPILRRTAGRPKVQRYKGSHEGGRMRAPPTSPICHGTGHRWTTCKRGQPDADDGPKKKRKRTTKKATVDASNQLEDGSSQVIHIEGASMSLVAVASNEVDTSSASIVPPSCITAPTCSSNIVVRKKLGGKY